MATTAEIWSELDGAVEASGARLYPALIHTEEGFGLIAGWPTDEWRAFLEVARGAGAKLV